MANKPTYKDLLKKIKALEKENAKLKADKGALKETEDKYRQIIHGNAIPTFVIDNNHILTHCNRAYEKLTGIQAHTVIGTRKQWMSFYDKERPVMADLIVENASEEEFTKYYGDTYRKSAVTEGGYEAEGFFPALGENGKWLFFTAAPLKDKNGRITGAIETLQDVTERKRSEEAQRKSESRLRALLNFVPYPIVVFTLRGRVFYLNSAFTECFGWTLQELEGKTIPYVPSDLKEETVQIIGRLLEERILLRHETKRLTKDGRVLDLIMRAGIYSLSDDEPGGELVLFRDVTQEKRIARNNEAVLRISLALPEYPDLEDLLYYISNEVKQMMVTEGALVTLLDEMREELFFLGAAYDDTGTEKRMKKIRFPLDELIAGQVIKTGEPIIVNDIAQDSELHRERDKKLGYRTRNLLLVPLRSSDRIIGVLCAINKKEGDFDQTDVEMLSMIAGTVALSIENARFADDIIESYREVTSLNRAKDKAINHLSHEMKTPLSVLSGSLDVLERRLGKTQDETWKQTMNRAKRNLDRLLDIQDEVDDIVQDKHQETYRMLSVLLDQCTDELENYIAQELEEGIITDRIRKRIKQVYGLEERISKELSLHEIVKKRIGPLKKRFSHRNVTLNSSLESVPTIFIPPDVLEKMIDGLVKNAVENTPDEGQIEIIVRKKGAGAELIVRDEGVGITRESQKRIFEGFVVTQDTLAYSSKKPFDFNAGGRGADLLRMKIFSERYNFEIHLASSRCPFIPKESDSCPGRISECRHCKNKKDCGESGGSVFLLYFPPYQTR